MLIEVLRDPGGQVAELRARIEAGEFAADGKLPSVRTLMQEYGVAYDTGQHAVQVLDAEGLVRRYHGRGYYVTRHG